ncbi:hypothetical protein DICPUDRAFT_37318 [Dictyostelium purpureum]|uniref:C2 domain-containing protein n=1 Tax=Dictyostelium purpureum TaxID=5786 RepID=F0ZSM5_DICPU|nr:uncharacterized protein DICPUDRAFT_37318 [Dictyostelium purpureum]EGC33061.1 hypothetical protein DICPUDRAFT_37318 [Dictyostelium purpureum]|eukprot:XP_003290411.1 hypothetical protein DICPUDRAFT_37318 [Dictyostelium purpureum]
MEKDDAKRNKVNTNEYEVHIQSGTVFEATDSNGLSDPYVTISMVREDGKTTKQIYRSSVCKKTLSPKWDEKGTMKFKENVSTLIIQLWDQDIIGSNDFIGGTSVDVASCKYGNFQYIDAEVFEEKEGKVVTKGNVKLSIEKKKAKSVNALYSYNSSM